MPDKKNLSERDICTQYINPALHRSGWDFATQVHGEVALTNSRVIVRGKLHSKPPDINTIIPIRRAL